MNASPGLTWIGLLAAASAVATFSSCAQSTAPSTAAASSTKTAAIPAPTSIVKNAENLRLGSVDFPTSGAPAAQPHFLHGVAALHSFWYEEALEAFARAAAIDPSFAMAYWGEAMCYYRSYRPGSDYNAGRKALAKIKNTSQLTARERGYIEALRTLYGTSGSPDAKAYAVEMEKLHRAHPNDHEATAFYSLALLANRGRENLDKAGALAEDVYRANPNHPGAAHYIIHSYDDPGHARRALEAAHHYSKIAPDAPHALHMPSHIFVQLGMWREAMTSNDLGWAASVDYVKRRNLTPTLRDYHNLHWLIYASLQEGRYAKARELVEQFVRMRANNELASYSARYINSALAAYVIETRAWDRADALFAYRTAATQPSSNAREIELCGAEPAGANAKTTASKNKAVVTKSSATPSSNTTDTAAFLRAYAAAIARGDAKDAAKFSKLRALQLTGLAHAHAKDFPSALKTLREAAAMEAKTGRPPGPPVEKPAHELLGEVLLQAGKPAEAIAEFQIALERHPNRALSLLGLARAEAAAGNRANARGTYARLLEIWRSADADLPDLREAQSYVGGMAS